MLNLFNRKQSRPTKQQQQQQARERENISGTIQRITQRGGSVGLSGYVTSFFDVLIDGKPYYSGEGTKNMLALSLARPGDQVSLKVDGEGPGHLIVEVESVTYLPSSASDRALVDLL